MKVSREQLATAIHALYHGTRSLGMGYAHNRPDLTVEQTEAALKAAFAKQGSETKLYLDYFFGRPLKVHWENGRFGGPSVIGDPFRLYDRDAGLGCAHQVLAAVGILPE